MTRERQSDPIDRILMPLYVYAHPCVNVLRLYVYLRAIWSLR